MTTTDSLGHYYPELTPEERLRLVVALPHRGLSLRLDADLSGTPGSSAYLRRVRATAPARPPTAATGSSGR